MQSPIFYSIRKQVRIARKVVSYAKTLRLILDTHTGNRLIWKIQELDQYIFSMLRQLEKITTDTELNKIKNIRRSYLVFISSKRLRIPQAMFFTTQEINEFAKEYVSKQILLLLQKGFLK